MNEKQADTLLNVPEIVKRAKIALNLKRLVTITLVLLIASLVQQTEPLIPMVLLLWVLAMKLQIPLNLFMVHLKTVVALRRN